MALTKAEKQILEDYGNDPNYRIETNSRNKIVAVQIKPVLSSNMQRFVNGDPFTHPNNGSFSNQVIYYFDEKQCKIFNNAGADFITVMAVFSDGVLFKVEGKKSEIINFHEVNFMRHDR